MGAYLSEKFPTYTWEFLNDSTIHLKSVPRNVKRYIQPNDKTFLIDKSSDLCQLLIPLDSIESFNTELRAEFQKVIVNYNFTPNKEQQEFIDLDSAQFYPMLRKEDFGHYLSNFTTKFESLGIYNGKRF